GPVALDTTIGADARSDDVHAELWDARQRQRLGVQRNADVHQSFIGAYLNEELSPARWLRANVGGRADLLSFAVDDRLMSPAPAAPSSGVGAAQQFSPKASLIVTPVERERVVQLDLYANY